MHVGKFILVASSIQAVFFLWRPPSKCFRNLAIVQLALMSATVLEPKPSFASWQMSLPIGSLFVSYLLYVLWEKRTFTATITAVAILVALWLYSGRGLAKNVRLGRHPERWLMVQVDASNALGCGVRHGKRGLRALESSRRRPRCVVMTGRNFRSCGGPWQKRVLPRPLDDWCRNAFANRQRS